MDENIESEDLPAAARIRYYVFGLLRKYPDQAKQIPSSRVLAEKFNTTRRIVRYELERLVKNNVLLTKKRVGTFTNPQNIYAQHVRLDGYMPLIGVLHASGDFFTYSAYAAYSLAALFTALTKANCYIHDLRIAATQGSGFMRDIKSLGLDGIIWSGFGHPEFTIDLATLQSIQDLDIPVVTMDGFCGNLDGVGRSYLTVSEKIAQQLQSEGRRHLLSITKRHYLRQFYQQFDQANQNQSFDWTRLNAELAEDAPQLLIDQLQQTPIPEAIFCESTLAKAFYNILTDHNLIATNKCRLIVVGDFSAQQCCKVWVIHLPYQKMAQQAIDILKSIKNNAKDNTNQPIHCIVTEFTSPLRVVCCEETELWCFDPASDMTTEL